VNRLVGPALRGRIARRILVDWLVDAQEVVGALPDGLHLRLVDGRAVVGICLIELDALRPRGLPEAMGRSVSAVAHRVSVCDGSGQTGVYVPRRDTPSIAAQAMGGRIWPGVHGPADVRWTKSPGRLRVTAVGPELDVAVEVAFAPASPAGADLVALHASEPIAWSPGRRGGLEVAELRCETFQASPVQVLGASSTWLASTFGPLGPARALEMHDVPVRWRTPRAGTGVGGS
jgi:hypothetical protein